MDENAKKVLTAPHLPLKDVVCCVPELRLASAGLL